MEVIIMCAGKGTRWNNYLGVPKQLVEINKETLLGRTTRLLKERGIDYLITGNNEEFKKYGKVIPQTNNDCEIERYEERNNPVLYLYGDVYYTEHALDIILNTPTNDVLFFGHSQEIFAVKVQDLEMFYQHKAKVKEKYLKGEIDRCIGWEVYRSIVGIPLNKHWRWGKYILIEDGTDDIDYPEDYEKFKEKFEK